MSRDNKVVKDLVETRDHLVQPEKRETMVNQARPDPKDPR